MHWLIYFSEIIPQWLELPLVKADKHGNKDVPVGKVLLQPTKFALSSHV